MKGERDHDCGGSLSIVKEQYESGEIRWEEVYEEVSKITGQLADYVKECSYHCLELIKMVSGDWKEWV